VDARVATAWVLNLDADFELAFGEGYAPTKSVQNATKHYARALARTLLEEGDVVVDDEAAPNSVRGFAGRAFCPTPRALALLERAGASIEAHPSFAILRRVNGCAFCHALGETLEHAAFVSDLGGAWRVKRSWGVAGRGQRIVRPGEDHSFLKSWIAEGGVMIEPNVDVVRELGMHAMLDASGAYSRGALVTQTCDASGAWLATTRLREDEARERRAALLEQIEIVARALHEEKYFGPFGIDAFEYRVQHCDGEGAIRFQPRSEINARYSMGFPIGKMHAR
jgi:hypothetical protein